MFCPGPCPDPCPCPGGGPGGSGRCIFGGISGNGITVGGVSNRCNNFL